MKISALTLAAAMAFTACSQEQDQTAALPAVDAAVAALLPTGTYTFTGGLTLGSEQVTAAEGFVDFGTKADGADCEADYTLTDVNSTEDVLVEKVRGVRTAGKTSFYQDITDPANPGEWKDRSDPESPSVFLMFVPALIASSDGGGGGLFDAFGNGNICSIGLMARFMNVASGEGEGLVFDAERTAAVLKARYSAWSETFVEALGVQGAERDMVLKSLNSIATPTFDTLTSGTVIRLIPSSGGGFTLTQAFEGEPVNLEITFVPVPDRKVDPIDAPTYFEAVARSVEKDGLEQFLKDLGI